MAENSSSGFSIAAMLATLLFAGALGGHALTTTPAAPAPTGEAPEAKAEPTSKAEVAAAPPTQRYDGMGRRLLALAGARSDSAFGPATLAVSIATLPDPQDSHEDNLYDAFLEAIRRAHQYDGYVLARMFLPWSVKSDTVLEDEYRSPLRQALPGVLLFRSTDPDSGAAHPRYRLVYLVGEVPTSGAHLAALDSALAERDRLLPAADARPLQLIGPTFSGSAPALAARIAAWARARPGRAAQVTTGSATDAAIRDAFNRKRVPFASTVHSDAVLLRTLLDFVVPRLGLKPVNVAILSEGSAYGGEVQEVEGRDTAGLGMIGLGKGHEREPVDRFTRVTKGDESLAKPRAGNEPLRMTFPMNVGTIRAEYQAARANAGERPAPGVSLALDDPARPMETPPVSSRLTAASVSLTLDQVARTLRAHDIRMVAIAATDVRDRVFLASELRDRLRDVYLVVLQGSELYLAPELSHELHGMLVLSSYPLVPETQLWSSPRESASREIVPFGEELQEGVYNAALLSIGDSTLVDYGYPDGGARVRSPSVWLSAVGRVGMMPLFAHAVTDPYATTLPRGKPIIARAMPRLDFMAGAIVVTLLLAGVWLWLRNRRHRLTLAATAARDGQARARREREARDFRIAHGERAETVLLFRRAAWASLRYQQALYRFLAVLAVCGGFVPAAAVLGWGAIQGHGPWVTVLAPALLLATVALLAAAGWYAGVALHRWRALHRVDFQLRLAAAGGWSDLWRLNVFARALVLVLGVAYLALTVAYAADVSLHKLRSPVAFALLFHRAWGTSGLSPLVPLGLAAAVFVLWAGWHLRRIAALQRTTTFEAACLSADPLAVLQDAERPDADDDLRDPARWQTPLPAEAVIAVRRVRERLMRMVPLHGGVAMLALVLGVGITIFAQVDRSPEHVAGFATFDVLYRFGLTGVLAVTGWAIYRLVVVWSALQRVLRKVAGTPLVTAFERLPQRVSRLTRLGFVGVPRSQVVAPVAATQWQHLRSLSAHLARPPAAAPVQDRVQVLEIVTAGLDGSAVVHGATLTQLAPAAAPAVAVAAADDPAARLRDAVRAYVALGAPDPGLGEFGDEEAHGANFRALAKVLGEFWRSEPDEADLDAVHEKVKDEAGERHGDGPSTSGRFRRSFGSGLGLWFRTAEELAAVQVVDYAEWAIAQLRTLAFFLFVSVVLLTVEVSTYPYQPESLLKLLLFAILVITVGVVLKVMVEMNRDEVLSRVARTEPGKVTWDLHFVLNAVLFGLVPLITLISSEFPDIRDFLFAWVDPLTRLAGHG